ncbi:hypothetical protein Bcop_0857 [Bacteroides coprosuis DSM 18011]|uniref:Uncharacterized protein n=1 Tax=Bacteroides coprosuis DSM 18011 TaxID=679937 RepID=F3ZTI0_9BACE|nr:MULTISPECIES: hypothetical protein [Bacteroides]EGJ71070.1 hypothetical protein Bcop_0857 [Bacteroides coprosuis DSM 18011]
MGFFSKLFNKGSEEAKGSAEDFMSLVQVYFQSIMAINNGITNIRAIPDVANFKRLFKIPTQKGRLGLAEKSAAKKMLMEDYNISENFFTEIDSSIKKNCRKPQDVQTYGFQFQGFTQDLMMLIGNLMQWKIRIPSAFKKTLYTMTEKTVHDISTKMIWKKDEIHKTASSVRTLKERLGFSEQWMTEFVFAILLLAKKDAKKNKKKGEQIDKK